MRQPPTRAQPGESSSACRPIFCSFWVSSPSLPAFFDSDEPRWVNQTVAKM